MSQRGLREAYTETALKVDRQSTAAFVDVYRLPRRQYFPLRYSCTSRTDLILEDRPPPPFHALPLRPFPFYQFQFVFNMDKQDCSRPDVHRYTTKLFLRVVRTEFPRKYSFPRSPFFRLQDSGVPVGASWKFPKRLKTFSSAKWSTGTFERRPIDFG